MSQRLGMQSERKHILLSYLLLITIIELTFFVELFLVDNIVCTFIYLFSVILLSIFRAWHKQDLMMRTYLKLKHRKSVLIDSI